jgi:hypothetical protein
MRTLMQIVIPVESGNDAARRGTLGTTIQKLLEPLKPEAVYFTTMGDGERGGFVVFDLKEPAQLPAVAEPFFLAFNARLNFSPVMTAADLASAAPAIEKAAKAHGRAASA